MLTDAAMAAVMAPHGLTGTDYAVLSILAVRGPRTPTELARITGSPLATVSKKVRRLQRRGLVGRMPNPQDGRSSLLSATEDGRSVVAQASPDFGTVLERLDAALGEDRDAVAWALERLELALRESPRGEATAPDPTTRSRTVRYEGPPLAADLEAEAMSFIRYLQWKERT
jgi:DNA-binding MarR family transcriptional regulator